MGPAHPAQPRRTRPTRRTDSRPTDCHAIGGPPTHAGDGVLASVPSVLARDGTLRVVHHRGVGLRRFPRPVGDVRERARGGEHVGVTVVA